MNTSADIRHDDLRYAEYVLGVLDATARAAVEHEIAADARAAAVVAMWQQDLGVLTEDTAAVTPPAQVWSRVRAALGHAIAPARSTPRTGLWNDARLWRWVGMGASAVAAACVIILLAGPRLASTPTPVMPAGSYLVSVIEQDNGIAGWTATVDLQHARMIVLPATPVAFASGRAPQLWLIPPGEKPVSLGMVARDKPTTVALRADLLARLSSKALLAISVEPDGGSPTGQPTGAVVAKGTLGGA